MLLHRRRRCSPFREWLAASRWYMGQMFHKTCHQMRNWRWDNPHAIGDEVDLSSPQATCSGKVKRTREHCHWYGSDDLRATIEPPRCLQYKPGNFLTIRPLNWHESIDENDDDENWEDPGVASCGRSCRGDGNVNDDGEGEEETQGGENVSETVKWTKDGMGNGNRKGMGKGRQWRKGRGRGREMVKGKVLWNKHQG